MTFSSLTKARASRRCAFTRCSKNFPRSTSFKLSRCTLITSRYVSCRMEISIARTTNSWRCTWRAWSARSRWRSNAWNTLCPLKPASAATSSAMSQTARLDLHCHTLYSGDCFVPLDELVRLAAARGVTHLAITDHDSCECARRSDQETWPIKLIFGEEVTLADGTHLIALGIRTEIAGRSLAEALREMRAAGAFIIVPHPFKKASGIFARPGNELAAAQQLVAEFADAIEVCNSKLTDTENAQAFGL